MTSSRRMRSGPEQIGKGGNGGGSQRWRRQPRSQCGGWRERAHGQERSREVGFERAAVARRVARKPTRPIALHLRTIIDSALEQLEQKPNRLDLDISGAKVRLTNLDREYWPGDKKVKPRHQARSAALSRRRLTATCCRIFRTGRSR